MRYMGGKCRQAKAICEVISRDCGTGFLYCEPFCGGMWSAVKVLDELHPAYTLLADLNTSLIALWGKCIECGVDWLPIDSDTVEHEYKEYKDKMDMSNPLTSWYGIALSFGGKWFGGIARNSKDDHTYGYVAERKSMYNKVKVLRGHNVTLKCSDYTSLYIPDGTVVYCDPPYEGRVKAHHFKTFDYAEFWQWVRNLSVRCKVYTSCFNCPDDFTSVYEWGDTVVRHMNSKGKDGTNEKLVVWTHASSVTIYKEE